MPEGRRATPPPADVESAVRGLLHATEEFTRAYETWALSPAEWSAQRRSELDEAEHRLEEAQREVAKREAMARSVRQMLDKHHLHEPPP